ncbi:MAG: ribbon-helix-helix protein, CopG family [Candidatus Sumerlaeota bacterium]|nr:ribbon-helix-helix protein, CopG family [Candidatus Sumerlaeota bacterium]
MAQNVMIHIKMDPRMIKALKALARRRKQSVSEIVRQAVIACYQPDLQGLPIWQIRAISAYQGGYISLAKLAQEMGMDVSVARQWLDEHGIS